MTLENAIKKAAKVSGNPVLVLISTKLHHVQYKGYTVSFYANGRIEPGVEATNYYTANVERTIDDLQSDYFPGCFHDNLSQAFKHIDYMTRNQLTN